MFIKLFQFRDDAINVVITSRFRLRLASLWRWRRFSRCRRPRRRSTTRCRPSRTRRLSTSGQISASLSSFSLCSSTRSSTMLPGAKFNKEIFKVWLTTKVLMQNRLPYTLVARDNCEVSVLAGLSKDQHYRNTSAIKCRLDFFS